MTTSNGPSRLDRVFHAVRNAKSFWPHVWLGCCKFPRGDTGKMFAEVTKKMSVVDFWNHALAVLVDDRRL